MQAVIDNQRETFDNLYKLLENILVYFPNIYKMNDNSKKNILDKIRILNKYIGLLEDKSKDILIDLKNNKCIMDETLINDLNEEEIQANTLKDIMPLILLYQLTKGFI